MPPWAGVWWSSVRSSTKTVGWRRLLTTTCLLLVSVIVARYAWQMPLVVDAERALYDLRVWILVPRVDQDPRIVLVTYTDETLANTGQRSPLDRGLLAEALARIDDLGAQSIGIDILIDQPQPEDQVLIETLQQMRTPTYVAFASAATNPESVKPWQEEFQRSFQSDLGPRVSPASVRLETDLDNVIRSWPRRPQGDPPILADRMAGVTGAVLNERTSIDFRLPVRGDQPLFASLPIDLFASDMGVDMLRSAIAGRHVLVGGDISDIDRIDTPMTRMSGEPAAGLQVHAALLAQNLDGAQHTRLLPIVLALMAIGVVALAAFHGYLDFGVWNVPLLVSELALILFGPLALQASGVDTQTLPAFGWVIGWSLAYGAASSAARGVGSEQRRFAQATLGRYLPPDVARAILREPNRLTLTGERREIYALFSDIEGFTTLTHSVEPETMASLLNAYLDRVSDVVLEHGGTIDKFVGDCVVAIWGAPIARETDADQAVRAALAIARAGDAFTMAGPDGRPPMGRTRVGVHRGQAIVGNFGGDGRIQYTALGDVMNTAARLEGANKTMGTQVLISAEAMEGVKGLALRPLGCVSVRGRPAPLKVFDARPDVSEADAAHVGKLIADFDSGSPDAVNALKAYADERDHDPALAKLVHRLTKVGPGGCYALD